MKSLKPWPIQNRLRPNEVSLVSRFTMVPNNWAISQVQRIHRTPQGGYYVAGTLIFLESLVYSFNDGQSPEAIQEDFPSLKRAQIYVAIASYLDHQAEIDKYLDDTEREFDGNVIPLEQANPTLWAKIQRAKAGAAQGKRRS